MIRILISQAVEIDHQIPPHSREEPLQPNNLTFPGSLVSQGIFRPGNGNEAHGSLSAATRRTLEHLQSGKGRDHYLIFCIAESP